MITRVQVKNFRNLADIDVQLGSLTVLVGRNGTGKSTFLDALRFVRDALRLGLDTAIRQRGGFYAICSWSPNEEISDIEISVEIKDKDKSVYYSLLIGMIQREICYVKHELLSIEFDTREAAFQFETREGRWVTAPAYFLPHPQPEPVPLINISALMLSVLSAYNADLASICNQIMCTDFYTVFPNTLRVPQRLTSEATLSEDGANLGTTLRHIIKQEAFTHSLVSALGQVVEGVHGVRVPEVGGYLVTELEHEAPNGQTAWFPLAQESDGTLRVLGLLAALYQNAPHSLIGIEEPELSIHPGALAVLSEVIEEAATRSQVLITTQSPDLISRFSADQLRIVERVGTETKIGTIDEGQREAIHSQLFSAGDLLRIEGLHVSAQEEDVPSYA